MRIKKRMKLQRAHLPMLVSTRIDACWSMDFVSDQLSGGRRFYVLNVVDDYSREMVDRLTLVSISGYQVTRFLTQLRESRGLPSSIVFDNGTGFISKAMFFWSK